MSGSFDVGAVVEIVSESGEVLARGLSAMSSDVVEISKGKRTADLVDLAVVEVVHRDDLVVLSTE